MSSNITITLNLLVDTDRNRVVFAECGGDFVEIFLSYLTLPMASIVRLSVKEDNPVGSVHNIYSSVESLDNKYFRNETCKSMLLRPFDLSVAKLDSSLPISVENHSKNLNLYYCKECFLIRRVFSLYKGAKCFCGSIMYSEVSFQIQDSYGPSGFVNKCFRYMISDDCMITKASSVSVIALLQKFGIRDKSRLEEKEVHVNASHVLRLLECCLVSRDFVLTNTFLDNKKSIGTVKHEEIRPHVPAIQETAGESSSITDTIKLKLMINKFEKTVIHAEPNVEFINLLCNFLCFPVGCIVQLLNEQISIGCFHNIYKSVEALRLDDCFENKEAEDMLSSPKVPSLTSFKNEMLIKVEKRKPGVIKVCCEFPKCSTYSNYSNGITPTRCRCTGYAPYPANFHDPKLYPASERSTGFLNNLDCIVSDNLIIKPLSCLSVATNYLNGTAEGGIEFITVEVGPKQALALLKAAITSKTTLTDVFLRNEEGAKQGRRKTIY